LGSVQAYGLAQAAPMELSDEELDGVTAAGVHMDVELSAVADGPDAITSTQGSVMVGRTTALRVAFDQTAPPEAQAQLLGESAVEVGIATGKAVATGAIDRTCSAVANVAGADYVRITQTQNFTALTATCSCTAVAVGILTR
jgi:hypothetical protein